MYIFITGIMFGRIIKINNIAALFISISFVFAYRVKLFESMRYRENVGKLLTLFISGVLCFNVIFQGIIFTKNFSAYDGEVDYVVVLGAGIKDGKIRDGLRRRLDEGYEYAKKYKNVPIIVSGGYTDGEEFSEAELMKKYLVEKGISESRIIEENRSKNTYENLKFTKEIMSITKEDKVLIVSTGFHLMRANMIANSLEINCETRAASENPYLMLTNNFREQMAIVKTYLFDIGK